MRKLLLFILISLNTFAFSQDTTFSKTLTLFPYSNTISSIIKHGDFYYGSIMNKDYTGQNYGMVKFNDKFELIDSTLITLNTTITEIFGKGFIMNPADTSFIYTGSISKGTSCVNGYIVKFNKDLDTVWTKEILHPDTLYIDSTSYPITDIRDVKLTLSGDYLVVGNYNPQCQLSNEKYTFFMKLDTAGNILWQVFLTPGLYQNHVTNIEIDPIDSCFYFKNYNGAGGWHAIYKFDRDGNILWRKGTLNTLTTHYSSCIKVIGNQIILATNYYKTPYTSWDPMFLYVVSFDRQTAALNWVKKYNSIRIFSNHLRQEAFSIAETTKGDIAIGTVGYSYNDSLEIEISKDIRGHLILLDTNGDSIWSRHYSYLEDERNISVQLSSMAVCDDGGFLLVGDVYRPNYNPYICAWMAKTDSLGYCPGSFSVSIKEEELLIKHIGLLVYPNPATDNINLRFDEYTNEDIELKIYNSSGMLVKQEMLSAYINEQRININDLPSGLYIIKLQSENGIIYSKKILKN